MLNLANFSYQPNYHRWRKICLHTVIKYIYMQSLLIVSDNDVKNITFNRHRATKDSGVSYAVDTERNSKVAATLWEVLTYPSRKLADLLAMPVCMRPRDRGAKLHSWSSFRVACVLTFRAPSGQIRCWNAGPLVGATQCPRSPFPLLAACIGSQCRENSRASYGDTIHSCPATATAVPLASLALFIRWSIISLAKVS